MKENRSSGILVVEQEFSLQDVDGDAQTLHYDIVSTTGINVSGGDRRLDDLLAGQIKRGVIIVGTTSAGDRTKADCAQR